MTGDDAAVRAINQVRTRLHTIFGDKIDLSDVTSKNEQDRASQYLTRSLAALYIKSEVPITVSAATKTITDGFNDGGIDAIAWNKNSKTLYLVQTKWRWKPDKGIELGDFLKLKDGIHNILKLEFSAFNDKVKSNAPLISSALDDIDTKLRVALVHTSGQKLSGDVKKQIAEIEKAQNQYSPDFLTFEEVDLARVTSLARAEAKSANIDKEVLLKNFGVASGPYAAYYGEISGEDVWSWYDEFKEVLFAENLRFVLSNSEVNQAIIETIEKTPNSFWYYNNGITVVCRTISKKPIGGADSASGVFNIEGMSVVNGAQTIGSLHAAKSSGSSLDKVKVQARFISLKDAPGDFGANVTRTNNTQNNLTSVDFVALDPNQERLAGELKNIGIQYAYRRGDSIADEKNGFDIREATVALACANSDLRLAVYAKRYISGLWEDIKKEPYISIFNESVTGRYLWALVRLEREIQNQLVAASGSKFGREKLILVHSNRFLAHIVLNRLDLSKLGNKGAKIKSKAKDAKELTDKVASSLLHILSNEYLESYPGNLFKNQDKQEELKPKVISLLESDFDSDPLIFDL